MIRLQHQRLLVLLPLVTLLTLNSQLLAGFQKDKIRQIVCGKTSAEELVRLFGQPKSTKEQAVGAKTWTYQETRTAASTIFTVQLDSAGIVSDYSLEERLDVAKTKKVDTAALARIRPSESTMAEVEKQLGQPTARSTNCDGSMTASYMIGASAGDRSQARVIAYDRSGKVVSISGGARVDDKRWAQLTQGRSKEQEALDLLGEPAHRISLADGGRALCYFLPESAANRGVAYLVELDPEGTIVELRRSFCSWEDEGKRVQVGLRIDPERWKAIAPGQTTETAVLELFGPPTMTRAHPNGARTSLYLRAEGDPLAELQPWVEHSVTFDATGIVSATGEESIPIELKSRLPDATTAPAWSKCEAGKPAADALRAQVGEPTREIKSPDGAVCLLYLYEIDGGSLEMCWAGFDRAGRWLGVQRGQSSVGELNSLGRQFAQARRDVFKTGQSGVAQVVEALGAPAHILELTDRSSTYLYVIGRLAIQPQLDRAPTIFQRYSVCALTFDESGVLRSFGVN